MILSLVLKNFALYSSRCEGYSVLFYGLIVAVALLTALSAYIFMGVLHDAKLP